MQRSITIITTIFIFTTLTAYKAVSKEANVLELDKVMVKGIIPGPDLWRVSKGEHVLWILGTINPLPKRMKWDSYHVNEIISQSDVLLLPPTVTLDADMGFFQKLMLAKTAIGIKKNPDKQKLKDLMPNELYQRWLALKHKHMGNNRSIEKYRPIVAAHQLYDKALKKSGLDDRPKITKAIKKMAKKNRLVIKQPTWSVKPNEPKAALKKLKQTAIDDLPCFEKKLERLELDLESMKTRAIAWSYGDIKTISSLPIPEDNKTCGMAVLNSEFAQQIGLKDIQNKIQTLWIEAAMESLEAHKSTFAILPIFNLLGNNSYLDDLASQGYQVKPPAKFKN